MNYLLLPCFCPGRSIVIHKADPDSTRWVCADIKAKSGTAAKACILVSDIKLKCCTDN